MKHRFALILIALLAALLCACNPPEPQPQPEDDGMCRVMLALGEGVSVVGDNPVSVTPGESVSFQLSLETGYIFSYASFGSYDEASGTLTVDDVTRDMSVDVYAEKVDYDTTMQVRFILLGNSQDTGSVTSTNFVRLGSFLTVKAGNTGKHFLGWSFTKDGAYASTSREYTFRVTPDLLTDNGNGTYTLNVFSNYALANVVYYHSNGGRINIDTENYKGNNYLTVKEDRAGVLCATYPDSYINYSLAVSAMYDDGTFFRTGYVLKEYNTKPDGTGVSYQPGNKINQVQQDDATFTLYCIWEPDTDHALFTTEEYTYPKGSLPKGLEGYVSSGVVITGYYGSASFVTVPQKIDGRPVIGIGEGAFKMCSTMREVLLPRTIQFIREGAFHGCSRLSRMYYPSSILEAGDNMMDSQTKSALKTLVVRANMAPRFANTESGSFSVKLSRLMTTTDRNRIVVLGGSSAYQGFASEYFENLMENDYTVINFGTTRATHGALYLEALAPYLHEGDIVIYTPENSVYMWGDTTLYWQTLRDLELMNNLYANVDISRYNGVFDAFSDYTKNYTATHAAEHYEDIVAWYPQTNIYGDEYRYHADKKQYVNERKYKDVYFVTLNYRVKSTEEGQWDDYRVQFANKDYTDTANPTWISANQDPMLSQLNYAIDTAKASGAKVLFGFCPVDERALVSEARTLAWTDQYDRWIKTAYHFDGVVGKSRDYVLAHEYFYDCAFHTNNYGRAIRTYRLYVDMCKYLGRESVAYNTFDLRYDGCLFEDGYTPYNPLYPVLSFR